MAQSPVSAKKVLQHLSKEDENQTVENVTADDFTETNSTENDINEETTEKKGVKKDSGSD